MMQKHKERRSNKRQKPLKETGKRDRKLSCRLFPPSLAQLSAVSVQSLIYFFFPSVITLLEKVPIKYSLKIHLA